MEDRTQNILFSKEDIQSRVEELGKEITKDYNGEEVVIIPLLRGAFIFAADLIRNITSPVVIDFLTTSSYEDREESDGKVQILSDVREDLKGKNVIVVDDIADSGNTLKNIVELVEKQNPKNVKTCVMLDKPSRRQVELKPDYVGFTIDDLFIVGYGLNYGNQYRNIPYIFTWDEFNV